MDMKTRSDAWIVLNCLKLSSFFSLSPLFAPLLTQRIVGDVRSITREIEIADHDYPLPGIRKPFVQREVTGNMHKPKDRGATFKVLLHVSHEIGKLTQHHNN